MIVSVKAKKKVFTVAFSQGQHVYTGRVARVACITVNGRGDETVLTSALADGAVTYEKLSSEVREMIDSKVSGGGASGGNRVEAGEGIAVSAKAFGVKEVSHGATSSLLKGYVDKFGHVTRDLAGYFHPAGGSGDLDFQAGDTVLGNTTANGSLSVGEQAVIGGTLTAGGDISAEGNLSGGGTLSVEGDAAIGGDLEAHSLKVPEGVGSPGFSAGWNGSGFSVFKDSAGKWHIESDRIFVRDSIVTSELLKKRITAVDGELLLSNSVKAGEMEGIGIYNIIIEGKWSDSSVSVWPYIGVWGEF